jgi:galactofuranose transport system permease protein
VVTVVCLLQSPAFRTKAFHRRHRKQAGAPGQAVEEKAKVPA